MGARFDAFPAPPWVVSGSIELGSLGGAFVAQGRLTVGAVFDRLELYGGWDHLQVGEVSLSGPVIGMQVWL